MTIIDQSPPLSAEPSSTAEPFFSLSELRREHVALMRFIRASTTLSEVERSSHILEFLERARGTGTRIDEPADRDAAQSIIDYWTATVVTLSGGASVPPDLTVLAAYDPSQSDDLADQSSPFRGLFPFGESDASHFFGREEAIQSLLEMVKQKRLIVIVGPSGSGKSSLIFAGLLPRLRAGALTGSEAWRYLPTIVPGSDPESSLLKATCPSATDVGEWIAKHRTKLKGSPEYFRELIHTTLFSRDDRPALVVIDQFEELFTLTSDHDTRTQFVSSLLSLIETASSEDRIILIIREDFLERAKQFPTFITPLALFRPPVLTAPELRRVIEEPAKNIGLKFQEGIVDDLIKEVIGDPSALPLLQFALQQLWNHRERNRITWDRYHQIGRPSEALRRTAEEVFVNLRTPENQEAAKQIFLMLVQQSVGGEFVRRRVRRDTLRTLVASDRVDRVLDRLVKAGLVVRTPGVEDGDDRFEVAHETLIRNWPRLSEWLHDYKHKFEKRLRLLETAKLWQESGRNSGYLISGDALREAEEEQYRYGAPELKELVSASKRRSKWLKQLAISGTLIVSSVILSLLVVTIYLLYEKKEQLQSSVIVQDETIDGLIKTVNNASHSNSLPAQERRALMDSAAKSVERLADIVKGHPEYQTMLITLYNSVSDFDYDAEDWEKAENAASAAKSLAQPLLSKKPDDPDLLRLLFRSTWLSADALSEGNKADQAQTEYQNALDIAKKLMRLTNGDVTSNRSVAFIEPKLGDICIVRKDADCALTHYRNALAINQNLLNVLAKDDPAKPEVQRDLAANRIRIGDVFYKQKMMLDEALNEYQPAADIDEQLVKDYPSDLIYQSNLSRVYNQIASIYERQGDLAKAKNLYVRSLEIRRKLARRDPSNNAWLDYLATQYSRIGDLLVKMNDVPGAVTDYKSADNVWDILVGRIPDKTDWLRNYTEALQKFKNSVLSEGGETIAAQKDDILDKAQTLLNLRSKMVERFPDSAQRNRELAGAYILLGDVFKMINDKPEALKRYQEARRVIDNFISAHPNDPSLELSNKLRQDACNADPDVCL
jgi:tetratricopeptide (TPR) repeat protein